MLQKEGVRTGRTGGSLKGVPRGSRASELKTDANIQSLCIKQTSAGGNREGEARDVEEGAH